MIVPVNGNKIIGKRLHGFVTNSVQLINRVKD